MLKAKLTTFASTLIFASAAFASQEICPELSAIQAEGLSSAIELYGIYAAYQMGDFNTGNTWAFVIAPIMADSEEDALDNGNDILKTMTAQGVLIDIDTCQYETNTPGVYALAMQDALPTSMKIRQYLHR